MSNSNTNPFLSLFSLSNRTALVTGGTRGIGQSMTLALASAGADIVLVQRDERNRDTYEKVVALGRECHIVVAELGDKKAVEGIVEGLKWGWLKEKKADGGERTLDILVNCAGIQRRHKPEEFPTGEWDEVLQVNLSTVFILCRDFASYLLSKPPPPAGHERGCIINIGSLLSFQGGINVPAYAAAKGGILTLTKALSNQWSSQGIRVNAIAPGYIETDMNEALIADENRAKAILERIPSGRWGRPEDFMGPVVWLASARASGYVTGECVTVDGGWMGR